LTLAARSWVTANPGRVATFARPILDDPHGDVGTHRAFKGAFIVTWFVRFDAGEPHLRFAQFAKGPPDDPLLGKNMIPSHALPSESLARHTRTGRFATKEQRKRATLGDQLDPFPKPTAAHDAMM